MTLAFSSGCFRSAAGGPAARYRDKFLAPVTRYSRSAMFSRLILICAEPPGVTSSATPRMPKPSLPELIAVALDSEKDPLIHQPRLVERHQAGRIGDVA